MANPPLSLAYGYGIVLGLGFAFAFGMILTTWILKRQVNGMRDYTLRFFTDNR
jgi:hypothetical protein